MHGGWGLWSDWGACSATCGSGQKTKNRACSSPIPAHGGNDCVGDNSESQTCNTHQCPRELLLYCISLLNFTRKKHFSNWKP